jgi:hypothetical protein
MEAAVAGLRATGSAYALVCAHDGLCNLHKLYLSDPAFCASFQATSAASKQEYPNHSVALHEAAQLELPGKRTRWLDFESPVAAA